METTMLHLDPGVLSIIGTLLIQTIGIVWWAATMTSRMGQVEKDLKASTLLDTKYNTLSNQLAKQEAKLDMLMSWVTTNMGMFNGKCKE